MKRMKKMMATMVVLTLIIVIMGQVVQVKAATSKSIYVVSAIKVKDGSDNYTKKISYKNGFITKINTPASTESLVETFSYNKSYELKKYVQKVLTGDWKGFQETSTYKYKNGLLSKKVTQRNDSDKDTMTYSWKNGKIVSAASVSTWKEENGEEGKSSATYTYTYKNGHVVKEAVENDYGTMKSNITLDKNNNIVKYQMAGNPDSYYKATITYDKNKRITKMTARYKNPMMGSETKQIMTIVYKKVTVNSKYAEGVKVQQWQLLNGGNKSSLNANFAW